MCLYGCSVNQNCYTHTKLLIVLIHQWDYCFLLHCDNHENFKEYLYVLDETYQTKAVLAINRGALRLCNTI